MKKQMARLLVWVLIGLVLAPPAYADRFFTSGFELQSTTNGVEWFTGDTPITVGVINTTANRVRSGAASLRVQNPASGAGKGQIVRVADATDGVDRLARACVFIDALPDAATSIMGWGNQALSNGVAVRLNTDGTLTIRIDNNAAEDVGPGSTTLSTGQYYCLELRFKRHAVTPNAGADEVELRLDGGASAELASTTRSMNIRPSRFLVGANLNATETCTSVDLYFDDVAINNGSGTSQTSWPGVASVVSLFPNAGGEFEQTITLGGSAAQPSSWQSTDDGAATGAVDAVDFVTFTSQSADWTGLGSRIALALEDLPAADAVALVGFGLRVRNSSGSNSTFTLGAQTSDSGTRSTSTSHNFADNDATGATWILNNGSSTRGTHPFVLYADPDSAAWTRTSVNNLQYLARGTDVSPNWDLTSAWITVEYTPGEEPAPSECSGLALLGVGC